MGRTVIDLPVEEVVAFLENHDRRHEWDRYVTVSQVAESICVYTLCVYTLLSN